jgi:putative ABC transport system permease protein
LLFATLGATEIELLLPLLTVASGLIAYLLAGGFIEWIFENMRESTIRSQLGHIQIVRPGYFEKG